MKQNYFSFDVESLGLFGFPFCVGYVVMDEDGVEHESGIFGWDFRPVMGTFSDLLKVSNDSQWTWTEQDHQWVLDNVLPVLPKGWDGCQSVVHMCESFYNQVWVRCKRQHENLVFVTDCPFPVETHFLQEMLTAVNRRTMDHSPYPLIDVGSVLSGFGYSPTGLFMRRSDEMPAHNPISDARQSVRHLVDVLHRGGKLDLRGG